MPGLFPRPKDRDGVVCAAVSMVGHMAQSPKSAADVARAVADGNPGALIVDIPEGLGTAERTGAVGMRKLQLEWEARRSLIEKSLAALERERERVASIALPAGVYVAIEGVCRVVVGGSRGGERFSAVVVHVIADDEPARVVIVPVE